MNKIVKITCCFTAIIAIPMIAFLWCYSPIMLQYPQPTGQYSVGTSADYWVDKNRIDPFAQSHGQREFMVKWWYPSDEQSVGKQFPYIPDKMQFLKEKMQQEDWYIPACLWNFLLNITVQAIPQASISSSKKLFPVIVLSHGYGGWKELYTSFAQELASHGYVVIGLDHSGLSDLIVFPDNRVRRLAPQFTTQRSSSQEEKDKLFANGFKQCIPDIRFIIDKIIEINQDTSSPFYSKLDLEHIGVMGHSMGGVVALEACRTDERCKAVVVMDLWRPDVNSTDALAKPCLFLLGEHGFMMKDDPWFKQQRHLLETFCSNSTPYCSQIIIKGAGHDAFSDLILLKKPLPYFLSMSTSSGDQYATLAIINNHIRTFFDAALKY